MKKIALCSLLSVFGILNSYAATQCKTTITFSPANNNWNAGSDEYLFETKRDYLNAVNTGYVYECDSSWCANNSYVELPANHVFDGKTIREKAYYKCSTSGINDKWEKVTDVSNLTKCTRKWNWTKDGLGRMFQNAEADEYLYPTIEDYDALKGRVYSQVFECDSSVCTDGQIVVMQPGHVFKRNDINKQRKYKCVLGDPGNDKWIDITDDCEDCKKPEPKPEPKPKPVPGPKPEPKPVPSGCDQFKSDVARYTCCLVGEDVAKWENGICKCVDETQKWENGRCVDDTCRYTFTADIKCSNGITKTMGSVLELRKSAFENGSCPDDTENVNFEEWYKNLRGDVLAEFNRICPQQSQIKPVVVIPEDNGISDQELNNAKSKLQEFFKFAEENRDGWKTADGKFNTKRLASDLSAGVVLGTVGGVVSGVVIKKKQVEKGFDALHCTVGGQTIADWGDEFSVGLQR